MAILPKEIARRKTEANARAWCSKHGYTFLNLGAWNVFYQTPEQAGKKPNPGEFFDSSWYSSATWLDVLADLDTGHT